jgi:hypothetical protein
MHSQISSRFSFHLETELITNHQSRVTVKSLLLSFLKNECLEQRPKKNYVDYVPIDLS